jgi:hypothetical protein
MALFSFSQSYFSANATTQHGAAPSHGKNIWSSDNPMQARQIIVLG